MTKEIFISVDIEADGPIPGPHSMLSLGAATFTEEGNLLSTFSANMYPLVGSSPDPDTAKWWLSQPEAWAEVTKDRIEPDLAMKQFVNWISDQPGKPVFVGYPAGFDFTFVYWYLIKFCKVSPFAMNALDMKSYGMAVTGSSFTDSKTSNWPKIWKSDDQLSHVAVEDAIAQGRIFCKMLKDSRT